MDIEKRDETNEANIREGNISLILDSYDDLFSDFDPRPYSEKSLSDDFLVECRRAVREKEGSIELRLLVPKHKRSVNNEAVIRRRLKEHFKKHLREEEQEIKNTKKRGLVWFFIGSLILVISTFLYEYKVNGNAFWTFLFNFMVIISQPAGWFTFWEGLNEIFIAPKQNVPEYKFYRKMSNVNIFFLNY